MIIRRVNDAKQKSLYTEKILRALPDWFGNEQALQDYVSNAAGLPFWAAIDEAGSCVGCLAVKIHHEHTGDIYVLGILPACHQQGIGRQLMAAADDYFIAKGCRYVIVKTLSDLAEYEPYERTRQFYLRVGFTPLITLTEMWDEENPCLIMIKELGTVPSGQS